MSVINLDPLVCLKRARTDIERGNCEYNVTDYLDTIEADLLELQSIKEAKPSEALRALDRNIVVIREKDFTIIQQALLKPDKNEKIILGIENYINRRIEIEPIEDVRKAFIEIRKQLQVIKEVANNE